MLIVYRQPNYTGTGWYPIDYMVKLAADLFQAELLLVTDSVSAALRETAKGLFRRRSHGETCLVICRAPTDLLSLYAVPDWNKRFRQIAAWVIDSFWTTHIPRSVQYVRLFDQVFITSEEDVPEWRRKLKVPTSCLPWGTDALRLGSRNPDRKWDLIRVGRQPAEWEVDSETERVCNDAGIRFHGRPELCDTAELGQTRLTQLWSQCKFSLAFSNAANPTTYTHRTREYVTARWVDALACGTSVAGIAPKTPVVEQLFWPEATVELGTTKRDEGLRVIAQAVRAWRPEQAIENHLNALKRLDWRWRFARIAAALGESAEPLEAQLRELRQTVEAIAGTSRGNMGGSPGPTRIKS